MALDIEKLRLKEPLPNLGNLTITGDWEGLDNLAEKVAEAATAKALWGLWDMFAEECGRLDYPPSWTEFLSDLRDAFKEASIERPKGGH